MGAEGILYIAILIMFGLTMIAQFNVTSTFKKYRRVPSGTGITGAEAARRLLDAKGLTDVYVGQVPGTLSDHYDPKNRTVNLSNDVYHGTSIASVAVACHECGHAIQHADGYMPLNIRSAVFPVASLGSHLGIPLLLAGFFFDLLSLQWIGIGVFSFAVLFQLVTLPVEFNASSRALAAMNEMGFVMPGEDQGARRVLGAAAMTYVAAAAMAILQLIRLILIVNSRRRD